jgi:hypothetical protein
MARWLFGKRRYPDSLFKNRGQLREYLIHDRVGNAFQLFAASRAEIERAGLVAADDTCRFGPGTFQRHRKTRRPREIPATRDRENNGHFRYAVERLRRHDQDRPPYSGKNAVDGQAPSGDRGLGISDLAGAEHSRSIRCRRPI